MCAMLLCQCEHQNSIIWLHGVGSEEENVPKERLICLSRVAEGTREGVAGLQQLCRDSLALNNNNTNNNMCSPQLQLHSPPVQKDGGGFIVNTCRERERETRQVNGLITVATSHHPCCCLQTAAQHNPPRIELETTM